VGDRSGPSDAAGLPEHFELAHEEMYGEPFMIAGDAKVIFISWFEAASVCTVHLPTRQRQLFYSVRDTSVSPYHDPTC